MSGAFLRDGNADNRVIVTVQSTGALGGDTKSSTSPLAIVSRRLFDLMDQWLANIGDDDGPGTPAQKVVRNKPSALVDSCYDASLSRITNPSQCAQMFPYYKDPRLVAGAPATEDVFKCALKPVDAADYNPPLGAAQLASVRRVFPSGVCDWKAASRQGTPRRHVVGVSGPWDVHIASIAGDRMTLRR